MDLAKTFTCQGNHKLLISSSFFFFLNEALWERLLLQSNMYACQQRQANPPPPSFAWFGDFTLANVKTYLGLCWMMGILRLPKRSDYWRTKPSGWLAHTNFVKAMSRNCFDAIWRYLHLEDDQAPNPDDKLFKIRKFLNILLTNFKDAFIPGKSKLHSFYLFFIGMKHSISGF